MEAQKFHDQALPVASNVEVLRRAVKRVKSRRNPLRHVSKRAAVAAVFRADTRLELLFIRRADDPADPWSGQMAFPGGRVEATDTSTRAAAERETREEVGFSLDQHAEYLGRLADITARSGGKPLPLIITPHVFAIDAEPEFELNYEVAETLWVPVEYLLEGSNRSTTSYRIAGIPRDFPCIRYEGRTVWGLTLAMIDQLIPMLRIELGR